MNWRYGLPGLLLAYALVMLPFGDFMKTRPIEVKLGYLPHPQILKVVSGEHASTVAGTIVTRVLFYFGTILESVKQGKAIPPEFFNMFKTLQGAIHLDPYNMDAYYFAQAMFTWDLGRVNEVNTLLNEGMTYRTWDPWLPFYIGFNYAYFLKDYEHAAVYMQKAAAISGNPLFTNLAARYFYESEQSSLGLAFLDTMIKDAKNEDVRQSYEMRRDALKAVISIEEACKAYQSKYNIMPQNLDQLIIAGVIEELPKDPYGGKFYLDASGRVRSSSMFTMSHSPNIPVKEP